jgi:hypothetical protein
LVDQRVDFLQTSQLLDSKDDPILFFPRRRVQLRNMEAIVKELLPL